MWRLLAVLMVLAAPASGDVIADLKAAEARLDAARNSLTKRRALGEAISAYEAAMAQVAEGIDGLGQKIRAQDRTLAEAVPEARQHLGALIRLGRAAEPMVLIGQGKPVDTLRGLLVLERLSADAEQRVAALNTQRAALANLQAEHEDLLRHLEAGRQQLAGIRADLIAQTTQDNPVTAPPPDIGGAAQDLAVMALALTRSLPGDQGPGIDLASPKPLPVQGVLLQSVGGTDPAGVHRPGITVAAAPGALLTSPVKATVRFVGPLDGYGQVVIVEPAEQLSLILAGVGDVLVQPGEIVEPGDILGFLPEDVQDPAAANTEFLRVAAKGSGQHPVKSLYIELRHQQKPVDPTGWFTYDR